MIQPLKIKKHDRQPYYPFRVIDSAAVAVDLTGATIYCSMKDVGTGALKINRQTVGIVITNAAAGEAEYRWQSGDTDTAGRYLIEFEVNPQSGGKFTVPAGEQAVVLIVESLDAS